MNCLHLILTATIALGSSVLSNCTSVPTRDSNGQGRKGATKSDSKTKGKGKKKMDKKKLPLHPNVESEGTGCASEGCGCYDPNGCG